MGWNAPKESYCVGREIRNGRLGFLVHLAHEEDPISFEDYEKALDAANSLNECYANESPAYREFIGPWKVYKMKLEEEVEPVSSEIW